MLLLFSILGATSSATSPASSGAEFLIPLAPAWAIRFLLLILWLFVAAILLGPLIRRFRLEPHSREYFADDRSAPTPRR